MGAITSKKIFRCICLAVAVLLTVFLLFGLFSAVHTLRAPYVLLTNPQQLGKRLGVIEVQWNGKNKSCWVYKSSMLDFNKTIPCLMIYPKIRWNPLPYHALKITEDSIGVFNDGLTECLPMGKVVYESSMTRPVYSVSDDLKGWDAKFQITKGEETIRYQIFPSPYSDRKIDFTVPRSFFENLMR